MEKKSDWKNWLKEMAGSQRDLIVGQLRILRKMSAFRKEYGELIKLEEKEYRKVCGQIQEFSPKLSGKDRKKCPKKGRKRT